MNSMYLALGYRCNHQCVFCPCGKKDLKAPAASTAELIHAVEEGINDHNISHITLSGGEPTLHPGFHSVLSYCLHHNLDVGVLSNGDSFHSMENVQRLFNNIPQGNLQITTALHSFSPQIHNSITGKANSFQNVVQGLLNIMSIGIPITIKQVICTWNYRDLPKFIEYVFSTFGPNVSLTLCGMDYCGMSADEAKKIAVPFKEIGPYLETALDMIEQLRKSAGAFKMVTVTDLPLCSVDPYYWGYFVKVSRNSISQYSAPRDQDGLVITNTMKNNDCGTFLLECTQCCVEDVCPGVWKTASRLFGESSVSAIKQE